MFRGVVSGGWDEGMGWGGMGWLGFGGPVLWRGKLANVMCVLQKGVCVVWGAVALYGGAIQDAYAAEDRLRLPMLEKMRHAFAQAGLARRKFHHLSEYRSEFD